MSEHTKGPWTVVDGHYQAFKEIKGPSFRLSVCVSATDIEFTDYLSRTADLNLIAAAPDLLEALEKLFARDMEYFLMRDGKDDQIEAIQQAKDAIAKAKGEMK